MLGMVIDEVLLEECCDNVFVVVYGYKDSFGLVWLDIISGCFLVIELQGEDQLSVEL